MLTVLAAGVLAMLLLNWRGVSASVGDGASYPVPGTVSTGSGGPDRLPGSRSPLFAPQTYTVTGTANSGSGSLRQAILNSNGNFPGPNTIVFNIPGAGVHTIAPLTSLPALTVPVLIDGYTQ